MISTMFIDTVDPLASRSACCTITSVIVGQDQTDSLKCFGLFPSCNPVGKKNKMSLSVYLFVCRTRVEKSK